LAAVFAVKKAFEPSLVVYERWLGTLLCVAVLVGAGLLLYFIQRDIGKHRKVIGKDATAYTRGLEFTVALGASAFFSCDLWTLAVLPIGTIASDPRNNAPPRADASGGD